MTSKPTYRHDVQLTNFCGKKKTVSLCLKTPPPTAQLGQNQTAVSAIELYMYVGSIEVVVKTRQNYVRVERSKLDLI
jgi:hypothetical protein